MKNHQNLGKHLKSTNSARAVSRNFSNSLICYHPNKHLFCAQQSIFPFPGGQEPMPRPAPAAGSGCSASGSTSREQSQQGWAGPVPPRGVNAQTLGHGQQFPLLQLIDWLILQDKLLGILMHEPRCLLIIWWYLFFPYSPSQGEQAVNWDIKYVLKHLFKTRPRVHMYIYTYLFSVFHIFFLLGVNFRGSICESLPLPFAL